ncbi:MAG: FeoA family protein [Prochloraceae cyanobacterium]|nr:FeoA family protein [Prochloraceae cyanobacterium]
MSTIHLGLLEPGKTATILAIKTREGLNQRLQALGFRAGREVKMIRRGWFSGPLHVRIGTTEVMVRRTEAENIYLSYVDKGEST